MEANFKGQGGYVNRNEPEPLRGFAVLHREPGDQLAVWHVAYGDRQAKNVNAVIVDLNGRNAEEVLRSLTWRQILTTTSAPELVEIPGVQGRIHDLSRICDDFISQADDVMPSSAPRPTGPHLKESDSPGHVALAAANHLVESWNYWIRSIRKVTPPDKPSAPALPPHMLEKLGEHHMRRVVGEV